VLKTLWSVIFLSGRCRFRCWMQEVKKCVVEKRPLEVGWRLSGEGRLGLDGGCRAKAGKRKSLEKLLSSLVGALYSRIDRYGLKKTRGKENRENEESKMNILKYNQHYPSRKIISQIQGNKIKLFKWKLSTKLYENWIK
jgi:hypothetical protein